MDKDYVLQLLTKLTNSSNLDQININGVLVPVPSASIRMGFKLIKKKSLISVKY